MEKINGINRKWWKEAVVYQIYPRSFKDSNGDGIGDLKGIASELDYLATLGVDVIWLSPIFGSPNADNGYDISDYRGIMEEFGTMEDFEDLLQGVKKRNMKLLLDLVANHSSDEHEWFKEAASAKDNPYRDYYIWRPAKDGKEPNDWKSYFSGPTWTLNEASDEYYLHLFAKKQPDLNWENPKLRQEIYEVMQFWMDKGIDGFRMDVIPFISKDQAFEDYPSDFDGDIGRVYASGPRLHEFVKEMHQEVMSKYDMMTVGEAAGITLAQTPDLVDERNNELNMVFQFDTCNVDRQASFWKWKPYMLSDLKAIFTRHDKALDKNCWNTIFLSNHDNPRMVSRYGNDAPEHRSNVAKLLATMLLSLKGTAFIYQGDEMGMTNYPFKDIQEFDDIQARNAWQEEIIEGGGDGTAFIENLLKISRDHSRTPVQWSDAPNAGFSTSSTTWMPVNPNFLSINAAQVKNDLNSIYHFYRRMIILRKQTLTLVYGDYLDLDPSHEQIFCYTRTTDTDKIIVILNFSDKKITYTVPNQIELKSCIMSNQEAVQIASASLILLPYEARIYRF